MTLEWKVRSYRSENGRKIMSEDRRSLENKDFLQISQLVLHSIKTPFSSRKAVFFLLFCNFFGRPYFLDTEVTQTVTQTGQKIGPEAVFPPPGLHAFWKRFLGVYSAAVRTFSMVLAASLWAAVVTCA